MTKTLLNRAVYCNYLFTAGFQPLKDALSPNNSNPENIAELLCCKNGYNYVCFEKTVGGGSRIKIERDADCLVGFCIKAKGIPFRFYYENRKGVFNIVDGTSGKEDGLFRDMTPYVPKSRMGSMEDFQVNEMDDIHAVLRNDGIIEGRNYIPLCASKDGDFFIDINGVSEVVLYYMMVKEDIRQEFTRSAHEILLFGGKVPVPVPVPFVQE